MKVKSFDEYMATVRPTEAAPVAYAGYLKVKDPYLWAIATMGPRTPEHLREPRK